MSPQWGGTSAAIVPADGSHPVYSYDAIDDPSSPLNSGAWKRSFEVGWQTGLDAVVGGVLAGGPVAFTLTGAYAAPVPGEFQSGGGGGVSRAFAQPWYQKGVTDAAADGSTGFTGGRAVPDISALADPNTGFIVGQTQQFSDGVYYDEYRIGGTSAAAPLMAGIAAVANQKAGRALGFLNPRIYDAYRAGGSGFYDVDQKDLFGQTVNDPLPAEIRVNYVNSEDASAGLTTACVRWRTTPSSRCTPSRDTTPQPA